MTRRPARGFTLIEIMVTIFLVALIVTFVYQMLANAIRSRDEIRDGLEGPKLETAILDEIIRDLRFVYFRAGQLPADAGFWGRDRKVAGREADRVDFLTCRRSRLAQLEDTNQSLVNAPLIEVGYACRDSEKYPGLIELWRREDYFVDDDPTDGGRYDLVYDKLWVFNLQYYPPGEDRTQNDAALEEWDTKVQHKLPYAIVVTMEYYVLPPAEGRNREPPTGRVRRIVLLTPARSVPPDAAAMDTGMTSMR